MGMGRSVDAIFLLLDIECLELHYVVSKSPMADAGGGEPA
jgi:hypothetical protein